MFALPISMPPFEGIIFYQNSPKIKLFLQKNAKFLSAGAQSPNPQISPSIANFWLRTYCQPLPTYYAIYQILKSASNCL